MREEDALLGQVLRIVRDHRAGVLDGWPDSYTAAASEAVYLVLEQADVAADLVAQLR